ncbi:GTP-binding protein [Microcoleus sp. FACHB-53]|nr:GTP-binding protein [Microcoleus sp. FACHB-53]
MTSTISKKICMLGDFSVGKTSLIRRFVDRQFSDQYLSTVGVKISRKTVECQLFEQKKQVNIQLLIWDLEGNTKFKAVTPTYLQGASSAVVVADINRQVTIDHISDHIQCFLSVNPKGFVIVALNKSDLIDEETRKKYLESIAMKAPDKIIATYSTSAKTGLCVDEIFQKLAYQML